MAPLVKQLEQTPGIRSLVCVTAQHRQMLHSVWRRQRPSWITSISSRLPQRRKSESHSFMKKN